MPLYLRVEYSLIWAGADQPEDVFIVDGRVNGEFSKLAV